MEPLFFQIRDVFLNLFDSQALMATLGQREITRAAFIALSMIVFTETGLLVGFFLPGDSLLVTAGIVAWGSNWPVHWLIPMLCIAAIAGNNVGYLIGFKSGPRLFYKEKSFFFRRDYLLAAEAFYERHGGKTIILAQFMPIIRTFAPVVAGIGRMKHRRFLAYTIFGGIFWVSSMVMLGYILTPVLDPLLKPIFGEEFRVQKHIEKVIILVVLISVAPGFYAGLKTWLAKRKVIAQVKPQTPV